MRRVAFAATMVVLALGALWAVSDQPAVAEPMHASIGELPQDHEFLGARDGCRKCHLKQYRSWEKTPHATALDTLEGVDAENPDCVRCHVTGFGAETGFKSKEETPQLAGVTCEACHGAGKDYIDRELMKDQAGSIAAGLMIPDEQTCLSCHNSDSPEFSGSFDYEEMKAKGLHDISS